MPNLVGDRLERAVFFKWIPMNSIILARIWEFNENAIFPHFSIFQTKISFSLTSLLSIMSNSSGSVILNSNTTWSHFSMRHEQQKLKSMRWCHGWLNIKDASQCAPYSQETFNYTWQRQSRGLMEILSCQTWADFSLLRKNISDSAYIAYV